MTYALLVLMYKRPFSCFSMILTGDARLQTRNLKEKATTMSPDSLLILRSLRQLAANSRSWLQELLQKVLRRWMSNPKRIEFLWTDLLLLLRLRFPRTRKQYTTNNKQSVHSHHHLNLSVLSPPRKSFNVTAASKNTINLAKHLQFQLSLPPSLHALNLRVLIHYPLSKESRPPPKSSLTNIQSLNSRLPHLHRHRSRNQFPRNQKHPQNKHRHPTASPKNPVPWGSLLSRKNFSKRRLLPLAPLHHYISNLPLDYYLPNHNHHYLNLSLLFSLLLRTFHILPHRPHPTEKLLANQQLQVSLSGLIGFPA